MTEQGRVLHVVESFASGTLSALTQYVRSTPHLEHHLLKKKRPGEYVPDGELSLFLSVEELPDGFVGTLRAVRRAVGRQRPTVVHAHSSFAGVFVRMAVRTKQSCRIVYTPHCFAFERRDVGRLKVRIYRAIEWLLAANTDCIAACSEHEASTAKSWRTSHRVVHVPSFSEAPGWIAEGTKQSSEGIKVVTTGRVGAQKDPVFFAQVVDAMRAGGAEVDALWVGAGSDADERLLTRSGIRVSGWLSRSEAVRAMVDADLYIHSAAWEGFPISVLEAHALRLPILVRSIPAFTSLEPELQGGDPESLARRALSSIASGGIDDNVGRWDAYLVDNVPSVQEARLREVYL